MLTEGFLKLYKNYVSLNFSEEGLMPVQKRKILWFKMYSLNKKRRFSIFN